MGKKRDNQKVKENFSYYRKLKSTVKKLNESVIVLSSRSNHKGQDCGEVELITNVAANLVLSIEASSSILRDFKFKIYDRSFMQAPCYRFDSDGETHTNLGDIPLPARQVRPPHFHEYNADGVEIAYKTDILVENENILLSDRLLALAHFAHEENIATRKVPEIFRDGGLLPPDDIVIDPLAGEKFDE